VLRIPAGPGHTNRHDYDRRGPVVDLDARLARDGDFNLDEEKARFADLLANIRFADPDGTLHATPASPMEDGDVYVMTTKPWTKTA